MWLARSSTLMPYCIPRSDLSNQALKSVGILKSNNASSRDSILKGKPIQASSFNLQSLTKIYQKRINVAEVKHSHFSATLIPQPSFRVRSVFEWFCGAA
jgi:hypothetical protein